MRLRSSATLIVAAALLASCSSAPKPKTLNGRDRQPINTAPIQPSGLSPATARAVEPLSGDTATACEPYSTPPATTLPENGEAASEALVRVFRFQFPFGGVALNVPPSAADELLSLAKRARVIHLRGRTDGAAYSAGDEKVALNRALAARDYLVENGVSPALVQLDYVSGSDYLADNSTPEGRSRNRRVEVELRFSDETVASLAE